MHHRFLLPICLMFIALAPVAHAQTSYPMIMSLSPNSAQAGQSSEHTIKSRYDLSGTRRIWVSGTGVTAEPVLPEVKEGEKPKSATSLKMKITVAADAEPGAAPPPPVAPPQLDDKDDAINIIAVVWKVIWDSITGFFKRLFGRG
jgi:hypothetical protein